MIFFNKCFCDALSFGKKVIRRAASKIWIVLKYEKLKGNSSLKKFFILTVIYETLLCVQKHGHGPLVVPYHIIPRKDIKIQTDCLKTTNHGSPKNNYELHKTSKLNLFLFKPKAFYANNFLNHIWVEVRKSAYQKFFS